MRPSGDTRPGPSTFALAQALVLTFAGLAPAQDPAAGPELAPPANMPAPAIPPIDAPAAPDPAPVPVPAPSARPGRAVMAVPGLMGPSTARGPVTSSQLPPTPEAPISPGGPSLDGPLEMPAAPATARPRGAITSRPLGSEPLPIDDLPLLDSHAPGSTSSPGRKAATATKADPTPPPARRGRFFGLLPAPAAPASNLRAQPPGRSVVEEFQAEPTSETALKARIEKQARLAVGDRARTVDVRVEGRAATVQARGVKLFQKRNVRKALESLPALSGLRTTIDVLD